MSHLLDKRMGDSSEESSIASGIGGSIPFDLPGAVESEGRMRIHENSLVVLERSNSAISLGDVSISLSHSNTTDVGIQCKLDGLSSTMERCSSPRLSAANPEHSRRLHSVHLPIMGSPILTRSLPGTPARRRKSQGGQVANFTNDRTHESPTHSLQRKLFRNQSFSSRENFPESKKMLTNSLMPPDHDNDVS